MPVYRYKDANGAMDGDLERRASGADSSPDVSPELLLQIRHLCSDGRVS
jgi:hypothetical protein